MNSDGPLAGIRVLDFTRALAGPFCTRLLFEAGAEIIKIEPLGHGDFTRDLLPEYKSGQSGYFHQQNYGKRSVALDLRSHDGRSVAQSLASQSDVLVENFRPGVMDRLGLSYPRVATLNPGIVYCSVSGFGQQSALAERPGQDIAAQARSGLLDTVRSERGDPIVPNTSLTDVVTGTYAFNAIVAALLRRSRSSRGSWIDSSILASALQLHESLSPEYRDAVARRNVSFPSCNGWHVPRGILPTADGWLAFDATPDSAFGGLCQLLDAPHLAFLNAPGRRDRRREILEAVSMWMGVRTTEEVVEALRMVGAAATPVTSTLELQANRALWDRGWVRPFRSDHTIGILVTPISACRADFVPLGGEELGASTYDVLTKVVGLDDSEILGMMSENNVEVTPDSLPETFPADRSLAADCHDFPLPRREAPVHILVVGKAAPVTQAARLLAILGVQVTHADGPGQEDLARYDAIISDSSVVNSAARLPAPLVLLHCDRGVATSEVITQATSGLSHIFGEEDGSPYEFGYPVVSVVSGAMLAALSMLMAISDSASAISVDPQHVGLSLHDMSLVEAFWSKGARGEPRGTSDRRSLVPYGVYRGSGGHVAIGASQGGFVRLMQAMGRSDVLVNPQFATLANRVANRRSVRELIEDWLCRQVSIESAESQLCSAQAVCACVRTLDEIVRDRDLLADGLLERDEEGDVRAGPPFRLLEIEPGSKRRQPERIVERKATT